MFQRLTSALFGGVVEELRPSGCHGDEKAEVDEDWILVDYLGSGTSGSPIDEDLVQIQTPMVAPALRYASCTPLNWTTDTDPGGGAEAGEDFLCVDRTSMEESWFVTPPACFTGFRGHVLESSPLEDLLIEHPSMSVYVRHRTPRLHLHPGLTTSTSPACSRKKGRRSLDAPRPRPEGAAAKQRSNSRLLASNRSSRTDLVSGSAQTSSRNSLQRLNLLRPHKTHNKCVLQQPSQRRLNY